MLRLWNTWSDDDLVDLRCEISHEGWSAVGDFYCSPVELKAAVARLEPFRRSLEGRWELCNQLILGGGPRVTLALYRVSSHGRLGGHVEMRLPAAQHDRPEQESRFAREYRTWPARLDEFARELAALVEGTRVDASLGFYE